MDVQEQSGAEYSNEALRKLGARIRHYRRKRAMTQRDLSFDGCSYSYLARIEAGDRRPSPRVLYEIARRLDVTPEELTGETSTEQRSQSLETLEAAMLIRQGFLDEAVELLQGVLHEAQVSADSERASEALEGLGLVALARGEYAAAGPLLEQSLESTADADPGERTALYSGLVEVHAHSGDTARAMAVLENCLARLRQSAVADPAKVVRYSLWLSRTYADAGDHTRAGAALADALRNGDVRVDLPSRAAAAFALARAHAANGRIDQAIRHTDRALAMYDLADDNRALRESHLVYAQALLDMTDTQAAAAHLAAARGLLDAEPANSELGALEVEEARMALLSGDNETARAKATNAVAVLQDAGDPRRIGDAYLVLARVQDELGELERAERSYTRAVEEFTAARNQRELAKAYRWFGKFLKRLGRADAALEAFELAADLTPSTLDSLAPVLDRTSARQ